MWDLLWESKSLYGPSWRRIDIGVSSMFSLFLQQFMEEGTIDNFASQLLLFVKELLFGQKRVSPSLQRVVDNKLNGSILKFLKLRNNILF